MLMAKQLGNQLEASLNPLFEAHFFTPLLFTSYRRAYLRSVLPTRGQRVKLLGKSNFLFGLMVPSRSSTFAFAPRGDVNDEGGGSEEGEI